MLSWPGNFWIHGPVDWLLSKSNSVARKLVGPWAHGGPVGPWARGPVGAQRTIPQFCTRFATWARQQAVAKPGC